MRFDQNTKSWILDRVGNSEPLFWNEFIRFSCDELGATPQLIKKYRSKAYRNAVKAAYKKEKAQSKQDDYAYQRLFRRQWEPR